jgi:hypothetical protein
MIASDSYFFASDLHESVGPATLDDRNSRAHQLNVAIVFQRLAAEYSEAEKQALFSGTAARAYRLAL